MSVSAFARGWFTAAVVVWMGHRRKPGPDAGRSGGQQRRQSLISTSDTERMIRQMPRTPAAC
jgi:hypothetical protein